MPTGSNNASTSFRSSSLDQWQGNYTGIVQRNNEQFYILPLNGTGPNGTLDLNLSSTGRGFDAASGLGSINGQALFDGPHASLVDDLIPPQHSSPLLKPAAVEVLGGIACCNPQTNHSGDQTPGDFQESCHLLACLFRRPSSRVAALGSLSSSVGWIDPNHFWLTPTADCSCSAPWIELAGLLVHDSTVPTDLHGLTTVTFLGCHKLGAAVAMPVVVPIHK